MQRTDRLFELIQLLRRASGPVSSGYLAKQLEVSQRTIYRDIVTLQSMRVPIDGEVGVGYVIAGEYDLPPLNFGHEEVEAICVGLAMLSRTGDKSLQQAAARVLRKIDTAKMPLETLSVSNWGINDVDPMIINNIRRAIRDERKVSIRYVNLENVSSVRIIRPLSMTYYIKVVVLGAWCELRKDFRHFRIDRVEVCDVLEDTFTGEGAALRLRLQAEQPDSRDE